MPDRVEDKAVALTSGRVLARNTVWNLIGHGIPMLVGLFTIPILIRGLGTDRFGILLLVWMLIGYFNLFDLGLGRALTKFVAERLGKRADKSLPYLVWTGLTFMLALGIVGALVVGGSTPWLVYDALKIPAALQPESQSAFYILAFQFVQLVTSEYDGHWPWWTCYLTCLFITLVWPPYEWLTWW